MTIHSGLRGVLGPVAPRGVGPIPGLSPRSASPRLRGSVHWGPGGLRPSARQLLSSRERTPRGDHGSVFESQPPCCDEDLSASLLVSRKGRREGVSLGCIQQVDRSTTPGPRLGLNSNVFKC